MARIRTIKPDFFTSEDITELSPLARLLYVALWCEADREGRLVWKPKTFKLRYLPADDCDIEKICQELLNLNLVIPYGDGLAFIPTFGDHQHLNPREAASTLAPPNASATRRSRVKHASPPVPDAQVGREGKGREGEAKEQTTPNPSADAKGNIGGSRKRVKITFDSFVDACHESGEKAVPADDPIFRFAADASIPKEFLHLAWREFANKHRGTQRLQKDWRAHFRDAVRRNWFKLWWMPSEGTCELTTAGVQLKRELEAERQRQQQGEAAA